MFHHLHKTKFSLTILTTALCVHYHDTRLCHAFKTDEAEEVSVKLKCPYRLLQSKPRYNVSVLNMLAMIRQEKETSDLLLL